MLFGPQFMLVEKKENIRKAKSDREKIDYLHYTEKRRWICSKREYYMKLVRFKEEKSRVAKNLFAYSTQYIVIVSSILVSPLFIFSLSRHISHMSIDMRKMVTSMR